MAKSILILLGIAAAASLSVLAVPAPTPSFCKSPKDVVDFVWNPTDLEDDGYYFPMGSLSKLSSGPNDIQLPGVSQKCQTRLLWKLGSTDTVFYGCGNKTEHFNCAPVDQKLWVLDCKQTSNETGIDLSHRVFGTLSDGRSFAFINRCFYNINQEDWIVFSTTKDLPSTTRFEVLVHAAMQDYYSYRQ